MIKKNEILFYNNENAYTKITMNDSREIFNRFSMQNTLDKLLALKNVSYSYDDIIRIEVNNLSDLDYINDLPHNLQELIIIKSVLRNIIIPKECQNLHTIIINFSLLMNLPITEHLSNLIKFNINNSIIETISSDYVFPPNIKEINLSSNNLTNTINDEFYNTIIDYELFEIFPKNMTTKINLYNNYLKIDKYLYDRYKNINYGKQKIKYHKNKKNNYYEEKYKQNDKQNDEENNESNIDIKTKNINYDIYKKNAKVLMMDETYRQEINVINSSQNVHLTSICNSIDKNLNIIIKLTSNYDYNKKMDYINEFVKECKKKNYSNLNDLIKKYGYVKGIYFYLKGYNDDYQKNIEMIDNTIFNSWIICDTTYKQTKFTYSDIFARIWLLVKDHPDKKYFINNIKIELNDSVGYCWMGRFNRLVNSLVGYIDNINVGISIKEQIEIEISKLIDKLNNKKINYEECKKEFELLFSDENVKNDPDIKTEYIDAWMDALKDYDD